MISIEIKIKKIPTSCSKCQFYIPREYSCHNERGVEANCALGYMNGKDMRDVDFHSEKRKSERFSGCRLELNKLP